jgi:hypothetical protein
MVLGPGLVVEPWDTLPAAVNMNYSIIADHTGGDARASAIMVAPSGTITFNHGLFANNTQDTNENKIPITPGIINGLSTMLSASSAGFISPGSPNYNYRIRLSSAAINQATGSAIPDDIEGESRPYNIVSDLGAVEYWPFVLTVVSGNGTLRLDWTDGASVLAGGVSYYEVVVTCETGADPPEQGDCGQPINTGMATTLNLTGLSNFMQYTIVVNVRDSSQNLLATSTVISTSLTNILIYLPLVIR